MTKLIVAATAVAVTLLAGAARPEETSTAARTDTILVKAVQTDAINMREGVVSRVDPSVGSLILADGQSYQMVDPALLFGYGRGDAVVIGYDMEQGQKVARSLYRVPLSGSY